MGNWEAVVSIVGEFQGSLPSRVEFSSSGDRRSGRRSDGTIIGAGGLWCPVLRLLGVSVGGGTSRALLRSYQFFMRIMLLLLTCDRSWFLHCYCDLGFVWLHLIFMC